MESFKITKIRGPHKTTEEDLLTEEVPLKLMAGYKCIATLICSPVDLEDLVRGFLLTSGLVGKPEDIGKIVLNRATWIAYIYLNGGNEPNLPDSGGVIGTGCGAGAFRFFDRPDQKPGRIPESFSDFRINRRLIKELMVDFKKRSFIHKKTGGVHGAALADRRGIILFREDIGRHNAVDKVIGRYVLENHDFEDKILVTSGRISSEVLLKMQRFKLPLMISRSAPTNRSVYLAREMGLTLVGFARGDRMNVYSAEDRIIV